MSRLRLCLQAVVILAAACLMAKETVAYAAGSDAGPAAAADASTATPCAGSATQLEATRCWGAAAKAAEASLADDLAKSEPLLRRKAGDVAAALFRDVQAHWGNYRDAECALQRKLYEGGSAQAMTGFVCRWRMATERAKELKTDRDDWAR